MKHLKLLDNTSEFKIDDTNTLIRFSAWKDSEQIPLARKNVEFKISNSIGFVKSVDATIIDDFIAAIDSSKLSDLPPDQYFIELWVESDEKNSIFPSDGVVKFTINKNSLNVTGETVTSLALNDFADSLKSSFENYMHSIETFKGDKGNPGKNGVDGRDGKNGIDGRDGKSSYIHVAYKNVDGIITRAPQKDSRFLGVYVDNEQETILEADRFDWMLVGASDQQVKNVLKSVADSTGWLQDGFNFKVDVKRFKYQILNLNGAKTLQLSLHFRCNSDLLKRSNKIADLPQNIFVDGLQFLSYYAGTARGSLKVQDNVLVTNDFCGDVVGIVDVYLNETLFLR